MKKAQLTLLLTPFGLMIIGVALTVLLLSTVGLIWFLSKNIIMVAGIIFLGIGTYLVIKKGKVNPWILGSGVVLIILPFIFGGLRSLTIASVLP